MSFMLFDLIDVHGALKDKDEQVCVQRLFQYLLAIHLMVIVLSDNSPSSDLGDA